MGILRVSLYRIGLVAVDHNGHRFMISETWVSDDADIPTPPTTTLFRPIGQRLRRIFGVGNGLDYTTMGNAWSEELYPHHRILEGPFGGPFVTTPVLNVNAPEAAVRLRRVGSTGSGTTPVGRMLVPMQDDRWFTDIPHRRHVDAASLQTLVDANLNTQPLVQTIGGHTYTCCIWHRSTQTYTPVDHYEVSDKVSRVWKRWRTYDYAHRTLPDAAWHGPFF